MSVSEHWFTGIHIRFAPAGGGRWGWVASLKFFDDAFCSGDVAGAPISTEGLLSTRYTVRPGLADRGYESALAAAVDALLEDAKRMGIGWRQTVADDRFPPLYTEGMGWGDGWDRSAPLHQSAARDLVEALEERRQSTLKPSSVVDELQTRPTAARG